MGRPTSNIPTSSSSPPARSHPSESSTSLSPEMSRDESSLHSTPPTESSYNSPSTMAFAGLAPPDSLPAHPAMDKYIQRLRDHDCHDAAENTIQSNARFAQNARDHGKIAIFNVHTSPPSADEVDVSQYYAGLPEGWELGADEVARMETMHRRAQAAAQALRDANASEIYISSDRAVNALRKEAYGWPYAHLMHEDAKHDAARKAASSYGFNTAEQIDTHLGFVDGKKPAYFDLPRCLRLPYPLFKPTRANAERLRQAALATDRFVSAQSLGAGGPAIPSTGAQVASAEGHSQRVAIRSLANTATAGPAGAPGAISVRPVRTLPGLQALGLAPTSRPPTAPAKTPAAASRAIGVSPFRTMATLPGLQTEARLAASRFTSASRNIPATVSRPSDTNPVRTTALPPALGSPSPSTTSPEPTNTALHHPSSTINGATKYAGFEHVLIHTAKCDVCAHHNTSVLHRCYTCGWHVCNECMVARKDSGKHGCMGKIEYDAGGNASGLAGNINVLAMGNLPPLPTSGPPMRAKRGSTRGRGRGRGANKATTRGGRKASEDKVSRGKGKANATELEKGGETGGKAIGDGESDTGKGKRKAPDTADPPRTKRKYVRKAKPTPVEPEHSMDMDSLVPSIEEPSAPVPVPALARARARAMATAHNEIARSDDDNNDDDDDDDNDDDNDDDDNNDDNNDDDARSSDATSEDDGLTLSQEEAMECALIAKARGMDPGPRPRANVPVEAIRESDPELWGAANTLVGFGRTVGGGGGTGTEARAAGGRTAAGRALPGTPLAATHARSGIAAPPTTPAAAMRPPTQGQRLFDSIHGNAFTPDTTGTANQRVRPELRNLAVGVAGLRNEDHEMQGSRNTGQPAWKANQGSGQGNAGEQAELQALAHGKKQGLAQKRTQAQGQTQMQGNGQTQIRTQARGQLVVDLRGTQPVVSRGVANATNATPAIGMSTSNTTQTIATTTVAIESATATQAPRLDPETPCRGPRA